MKRTLLFAILLAIFISSCGPTQQITGYWVNKEAGPRGPYKSIFILVITENKSGKLIVEDKMSTLLNSMGRKVITASDLFPPSFSITGQLTREQLSESIAKTGCDAILTMALLDVKTVEQFQPGTTYTPMGWGYYGSYYGYYDHYYPVVYSPGYYSTDKTYYLETNFYDRADDLLLWSIQSEAYNPSNLNSWFEGYSKLLLNKLNREGLIKK